MLQKSFRGVDVAEGTYLLMIELVALPGIEPGFED